MTITSDKTLQLDGVNIKLTPFLERALPLARLGIRVFPCDVRDKEPVKLASYRRPRLGVEGNLVPPLKVQIRPLRRSLCH
jgi:hypothetical protein